MAQSQSIKHYPKWVNEAVRWFKHDKADTVTPTIAGFFQVRVNNLYRHNANIELRLVNQHNEVLKRFGVRTLQSGGAIVVNQCNSVMNIEGYDIKAYLQVLVSGFSIDSTECLVAVSLVDAHRTVLQHIGTKTLKIGGSTTVEGLAVTAKLERAEH